jgi:hypothetical protein
MNLDVTLSLEEIIRERQLEWLLESWSSLTEQAVDRLRATLSDAGLENVRRYGPTACHFTDAELADELQRAPHRVDALLQALSGPRSPQMIVLAWQIVQDAEVERLSIDFIQHQSFEMRVTLRPPRDESGARLEPSERDSYVSQNVHDLRLIRHLGIMELNGRPRIDGFFALRID